MTASWLELDGAVNARDVAGAPAGDDAQVQPGRLIRSDNLQGLTQADVRRLVDEVGVRAVVDLRADVEVRSEGPGPLTREPLVAIRHLSLFPEAGETTDAAATDDGPVALPWRDRETPGSDDERKHGASGVYLKYLVDRPDSIIEALRTIAGTDGATIVHCAAGKDRTGVVVAFALTEVGVRREAVVADYARTGERIDAVFDRLRASPTYVDDMNSRSDPEQHRPDAVTMERLLDAVDDLHGGVPAWLRANGWTDEDAAALRRKLLD